MLYKFINLPNVDLIINELQEELTEELLSVDRFYVVDKDHYLKYPNFVKAVTGIKPWQDVDIVALLVLRPNTKMPIHIDNYDPNNVYGLNIPLLNCETTDSIFYKLNVDKNAELVVPSDAASGFLLRHYQESEVTEVERIKISGPVLYNASVPHSAENLTDQPRVVLSVRFFTAFDDELFR